MKYFLSLRRYQAFKFLFIPNVHLGPFPILNKSQRHQCVPINLIPCAKVSIHLVKIYKTQQIKLKCKPWKCHKKKLWKFKKLNPAINPKSAKHEILGLGRILKMYLTKQHTLSSIQTNFALWFTLCSSHNFILSS